MFLPRIFTIAKVFCVLLVMVFPGQTVLDQMEEAGLIQGVSHQGIVSTSDSSCPEPQEDHDQESQDHCCCAGLDFHPAVESLVLWPGVHKLSFPLRNDVLPDGPTESIEHPPQIG